MPFATRQYAGFYRTNIPANCMWEENGKLYFGGTNGNIYEFYTDENDLHSYNDDGQPIEAIWESPDFDGRLFYKNKTFRYLAIRLQSSISTSIDIWIEKRGIWGFSKRDDTSAKYLVFSKLIFSKFSFNSDTTPKIIATKLRVKKVDKARFRFINAELNEPFGLFDVALEYVENGNYK